jgi:hypothetical protein
MGLLTKFFGIIAGLSLFSIPLKLFSDPSSGDLTYSFTEAFIASIFWSVLFLLARRRTKRNKNSQ